MLYHVTHIYVMRNVMTAVMVIDMSRVSVTVTALAVGETTRVKPYYSVCEC